MKFADTEKVPLAKNFHQGGGPAEERTAPPLM